MPATPTVYVSVDGGVATIHSYDTDVNVVHVDWDVSDFDSHIDTAEILLHVAYAVADELPDELDKHLREEARRLLDVDDDRLAEIVTALRDDCSASEGDIARVLALRPGPAEEADGQ